MRDLDRQIDYWNRMGPGKSFGHPVNFERLREWVSPDRHEGHHRGQIVMLARQLGHRLPVEITGGLWHFAKRSTEASI
jgi:DinB family